MSDRSPGSDRASTDTPEVHLVTPDHELRARVVAALAAESLALASAAEDVDELALTPAEIPPAVVIVAISDTPLRREATLRSLAARPSTRVIACQQTGRAEVRRSILAGACGYILRDEIEAQLVPALRAVESGLIVIPHEEQMQVGTPTLSPRERQVMAMVVMGYMNCEIANQLHLAESTVKSHLSSVFVKLGVRSRSEAVELILDDDGGLGRGIVAVTSERAELSRARVPF